MGLQSMTGFSRHEGQLADTNWVWEIRSVNGKGLDLRFRVPPGYEATESAARKLLQSRLSRGNLQISLQMRSATGRLIPVLNHDALDAVLRLSEELKEKLGGEMPAVADILAIRGVLELEEAVLDEERREALNAALQESFKQALNELVGARENEGAAIGAVLSGITDQIAQSVSEIRDDPSRKPEAIAERLNNQLDKLLSDDRMLDAQRLHQEVALLATKIDIQEELDRLEVHLASARQLLESGGPAGRKMDFLSQEINRECNTICSKSASSSVTAKGLDMKLMIDQFREQVQNME